MPSASNTRKRRRCPRTAWLVSILTPLLYCSQSGPVSTSQMDEGAGAVGGLGCGASSTGRASGSETAAGARGVVRANVPGMATNTPNPTTPARPRVPSSAPAARARPKTRERRKRALVAGSSLPRSTRGRKRSSASQM